MNAARIPRLSCSAVALAALIACGPPPEEELIGEFTSDVVQRDVCRAVGDKDEACQRDEVTSQRQVTLIEDEFDRVWINGIPRDGEDDRRMLGTRDSEGGFLFIEETSQRNRDSGCRLESRIELSLAIDDDADPEAVGTDPCVALLGRETRTTETSAECDEINDPPVDITRIIRRRWQRPSKCAAEEEEEE